jgi:hypothetical protein
MTDDQVEPIAIAIFKVVYSLIGDTDWDGLPDIEHGEDIRTEMRDAARAATDAYEATMGDELEAAYERGWNAAAELSQRLGEPVRAYARDTKADTRATISDEDVKKFWRTYNELRAAPEKD